jgi:hypothetical protein
MCVSDLFAAPLFLETVPGEDGLVRLPAHPSYVIRLKDFHHPQPAHADGQYMLAYAVLALLSVSAAYHLRGSCVRMFVGSHSKELRLWILFPYKIGGSLAPQPAACSLEGPL